MVETVHTVSEPMWRRFLPVAILLFLLPGLTACETALALLDFDKRPSARVVGARLEGLTLKGVQLAFDVEVSNPYAVQLPLVNLTYGLSSGGSPFLSGQANVAGSVPANGTKTIALPAQITFAHLLSTLRGIRPGGVVPYAAEITLSVDPPGLSTLALPIRKEGRLPIPTVPSIDLTKIEWKELSIQQAQAVLHLSVKNTNEFPIDLNALSYALSLGNTPIVTSRVERPMDFAQGSTNALEIPISFAPLNLGLAAFNMLSGSSDASYSLDGTLDLDTPFGPINMPYSQSGKTLLKKSKATLK